MGLPHAWLTSVIRDEHVTQATILAQSIRQTATTKRICVITCTTVSKHSKTLLLNHFDQVHFLDPEPNGTATNYQFDMKQLAKIFSFSLECYEKCIFLEHDSLLLENSDHWFQEQHGIVRLGKGSNTACDHFIFQPCLNIYNFLSTQKEPRNLDLVTNVENWLRNNDKNSTIRPETSDAFDNAVLQLSPIQGKLINSSNSSGFPLIAQLVYDANDSEKIVGTLQALTSSSDVGLVEKVVLKLWITVFQTISTGLPFTSPIHWHQKNWYYPNEPIAIVGISCRLPGANNLDEFWSLLSSAKEGVREPPSYRWKKEHCVTPVGQKERSTQAGFLSVPVDEFDAQFFGISPKEATFIDPQTRLLLEIMWESLENAGVNPETLHGTHTGIFTGSWMNDYKDIIQRSSSQDFFRIYMGNSIGASAARLSFLLGLTGPSIATESGCSSAMVAVDMAVKSLRCKETNLALAGGVNLLLHPFTSKIMDHVIAPDGRCKTFDAKADGFGRAEACEFLVLKRLSDALRDKDHIWAMIRGSAVSQEGISRSLGTPTVHCEALAMQLALKNAGVRPEQVSFVETHGTGTGVGDPMEVAAIAKAYHANARKEPLVIGSVKTNVGHTESVSGITGIIKTVLSMQHDLIPKHLNFDTLNPDVNLEAIPAKIPVEPIPWPKTTGKPRFAGVSSFGITGTDGHVILQETPEHARETNNLGLERPLHILKVSAKTNEALDELLLRYKETFAKGGNFASVAFTANTGRSSFGHRAFIVASSIEDAVDILNKSRLEKGMISETGRKICFLFTGQGSQYPGMAKLLHDTSPVFRVHFDHCSALLQEKYDISIKKVLWDPDSSEVSRTVYSQTSIFCVEYCLLRLWESWGVKPDAVLGHSLGEFCAAVAADMLSFEDALKLVATRSRLIDNLPRGSMLVLRECKEKVEEMMENADIQLELAALNSADQTVVAGDTEKISELLAFCKKRGLKGVILEATHAFHSRHMDAMLDEFRKDAQTINYRDQSGNKVQYISGMEGKVRNGVDGDYWVRHTREPVNFLEACQTLKSVDCTNFLEIGPQPVLSTFVLQNLEDLQITCYPSLRRNTNDWETILTSLGKLWLTGQKIDWTGFDKPYSRRKVASLPFYPFHRKSYWVDCTETQDTPIHPLIGSQLPNASALNIFQNNLNLTSAPYLRDHCIGSKLIFPGAGFTEMSLSAGYCVSNFVKENLEKPRVAVALENVRIQQPLELKDGKLCNLQVIVDLPEQDDNIGKEGQDQSRDKSGGFRCQVFHRNRVETDGSQSGKWVLHSTATFYPVVGDIKDILKLWNGNVVKELITSKESMPMNGFYKRISSVGLNFGDGFQSIKKQWFISRENKKELDEVVSEINIPPDCDQYLLHPIIIDAMFQAQIFSVLHRQKNETLLVPVKIGKLVLLTTLENCQQSVLYIYVKWTSPEKCVTFLCTQEFDPIAFMEDVAFLETTAKTIHSVLEQQNKELPESWEEIWKPIPGPLDGRIELISLKSLVLSAELQEKINSFGIGPEEKSHVKMTDKLLSLYILRAFYQLGWSPQTKAEFTISEFLDLYKIKQEYSQLLSYYFSILQDKLGLLEASQDSNGIPKWKVKKNEILSLKKINKKISSLTDQLSNAESPNSVIKIYDNFSQRLPKILKGEVSPIWNSSDPDKKHFTVDQYCEMHPRNKQLMYAFQETFKTILEGIKTQNETLDTKMFRVLQVGAANKSFDNLAVLQEIKSIWGSRFEYYLTDSDAVALTKAEKILTEFGVNLKVLPLDLENSPIFEGIPVNYFDCIISSDISHKGKNATKYLQNLRMCLRSRGSLILTEKVKHDLGEMYLFGTLEQYCKSDFSEVNTNNWKETLFQSGFSFVHCNTICQGAYGIIIAEADEFNGYKISNKSSKNDENKTKRWVVFQPMHTDGFLEIITTLKTSGCKIETITTSSMNLEQLKSFLQKNKEKDNLEGIIYAFGMDKNEQKQKKLAFPFLQIVKYIIGENRPPRLYIITKNVRKMNEKSVNPYAATIIGMAKALKNEHPDIYVRCIDLDENFEENYTDEILYEITMYQNPDEKERMRIQVAYRNGKRYEPKFTKVGIPPRTQSDLHLPPSTQRYQLVLPQTRMIEDLEFTVSSEEPVGEDEVEIAVQTYALNFKDVLAILKPTQEFEDVNVVGLDYAGVVHRVGENVKTMDSFKIGDKVVGVNIREGLLHSHLVVDTDSIFKIPRNLTFSEVVTLPTALQTSILCLLNVAKITKEDTVLIHTGSGGVGLTAIQLVTNIGAKIITTAGSPRKRLYLKSIGIEHVFHSRNTSYQDEILKVTKGRGVDVVLNSITGPGFKEATLAVCAVNARFIEMSKLSIWTEEEVKARRSDVHYHVVDLTKLDKTGWKNLRDQANFFLDSGLVDPIPFAQFDALRTRQALQFLQRAKHIGKVVVKMPEIGVEKGKWTVTGTLFDCQCLYLITGGLGGIGFEVCKWMVAKGARDIVLVGRNPPKPEIAKEIERLINDEGNNLIVKLCDIGDYGQCKDLIENLTKVENGYKPLRGIQHCAGVLRDDLLANQSWENFTATFNPKVDGTLNLHQLTKELPLQHFVLYSSLTALVGTPSQANHVAANSFQDAFAHYRHSLGLPATTINWGQWGQVGCAKNINIPGVLPCSITRMMNGLEEVMRSHRLQVCFSEFDSLSTWTIVAPSFKHYLDDQLVKRLKKSDHNSSSILLNSAEFWREFEEAGVTIEKINVVSNYLQMILKATLKMDTDEPLKTDSDLQDLGIDSLMMIELRNSIQNLLGSRQKISTSMLKDSRTINDLATAIVHKIENDDPENFDDLQVSAAELEKLIQEDCKLDESIKPILSGNINVSSIKSVLVTGATGQLGPYIVAWLCRFSAVERIICLIRTKEGVSPQKRLEQVFDSLGLLKNMDMTRIEGVKGDLVLENFGLEKSKYQDLCNSVDCIIHLAIKSNHEEAYWKSGKRKLDVRSVNVGGTLAVLKFAVSEKTKSVFHASTLMAVFGGGEDDSLSDNWPETSEIKILVEHKIPGYPISKFVCEMLMKQAVERGIPCKVFRFPWILGDSTTGRSNYQSNHYVLRFLSYLKLKAMPKSFLPAVVLPVDICADWSLKIFWDERTPMEIYNIVHPNPEPESEFAKVAKQDFNTDMELVDWETTDIVERSYGSDMPLEAFQKIYQKTDFSVMSTSSAFRAIQGYLKMPEEFFKNSKLTKFLPNFDKGLPSTTDIIRKDIQYVKSTGAFARFGL